VKADWGGITPDELEKSLEEDAGRYSDVDALKRIYLYFPEKADAVAVRLLGRQLYDFHASWDSVPKALLTAASAEDRDKILADYKAKNPEVSYEAVISHLIGIATSIRRPEDNAERIDAGLLLSHLSPQIDPFNPPVFDSASYDEQVSLISKMGPIVSKAVDSAAADILRRISDTKENVQFGLAITCAQRLLGKPEYENDIRVSLQKILAIQQEKAKNLAYFNAGFSDPLGVLHLQAILKKLPPEPKKESGSP